MSALDRSRAPSLFVEFAGLPGCGKSTIVTALLERPGITLGALHGGGIHNAQSRSGIISQIERVKPLRAAIFLATFMTHHFDIAAALLSYCLECGAPLSTRFRYALLYVRLFIRLERAKQSSAFSGLSLLDEAFTQAISSIGIPGSVIPASMTKLLKKTLPGRIGGIVMLDCGSEMLAGRISGRNSQASRFDRWSMAERKPHLQHLNALLHENVKAAEEIGIPILRLSSDEPVTVSANRVADWLSHIGDHDAEPAQRNVHGR